ncbi:cytochrome P450 [Xylariomycetidae sp. FL2044]|nr:cytochrome P450 [Xylariomycetidae sp. FL2044]
MGLQETLRVPVLLRDYIAQTAWPLIIAHVLIVLCTSLVLVFVRRRYFAPISHVPGPFLASFSRFWHLRQIWQGHQNLKLIEQHDKYGHFVRLSHSEVSVSHPNGIKALLLNTLPKGDWYQIFCFPDYRYTTPISLTNPKDKIERSKYLASGFLHHNVIKSEPYMDELIEKFLNWMNKYAESKEPMELDKFFTYVAFDITGEVLFSKPFDFLDKGSDIRSAIKMNVGLEIYLAIFGFYNWVHWIFANPVVTWTQLMPMGHLFHTALGALTERQKNPEARFDVAAHWFRGLERATKEKSPHFNLRYLQAAASSNVGAGSDTVSAGLQSFVYHMIRVPGTWDRVRAEIVAAQKEGRCLDRVITNDDAVQLPYIQACIKEALRVFGPVPMGLPRKAPKGGLTIGDHTFPEGVTLSVSPWVYHYSKEFWGPDARDFRPDRWLEPDASEREKYFIPWGVGYASCPGQHIARIQLSKILATVVRDYDIRQVDPKQEWTWAAYFTVVPHDWPVYVTKRT